MTQTQETLTDEQMLAAHEKRIRYLAMSVLSNARVRRLVEISDLCQVGRLALWQKSKEWNPSRGVRLWTFAQMRVRGAMIDHLRECGLKKRFHYAVSQELPGQLEPEMENVPGEPVVLNGLDSPLELFLSLDVLRPVAPDQRQLLAQKYVHGKTNRQIAAERGCGASNVSLAIGRTLNRIRCHMEDTARASVI